LQQRLLVHLAPQPLDPQRFLADQQRRQQVRPGDGEQPTVRVENVTGLSSGTLAMQTETDWMVGMFVCQ
jgi:hypothetical protein